MPAARDSLGSRRLPGCARIFIARSGTSVDRRRSSLDVVLAPRKTVAPGLERQKQRNATGGPVRMELVIFSRDVRQSHAVGDQAYAVTRRSQIGPTTVLGSGLSGRSRGSHQPPPKRNGWWQSCSGGSNKSGFSAEVRGIPAILSGSLKSVRLLGQRDCSPSEKRLSA